MFFVGLAGSFMPYLLFLGMLVALTLGTRVNPNPETIDLAEKTITYQQDADQSIHPTNDYYFFSQTTDKQIKTATGSAIPETNDFIEYSPRGKTMGYFISPKYSYLTTHNFFGLSPPALIS